MSKIIITTIGKVGDEPKVLAKFADSRVPEVGEYIHIGMEAELYKVIVVMNSYNFSNEELAKEGKSEVDSAVYILVIKTDLQSIIPEEVGSIE